MTDVTTQRAPSGVGSDGGQVELPFGEVLVSAEQLEELYRAPGALVQGKKRPGIDEGTRTFIERSPFVLMGTVGRDGGVDVSPRGGPRGFVRILDDNYVAVPDLNGNNLIDTLRAVVASGAAGMLFLVPGKDETVRVNGAAWVTTDAAVLDLWNDELRRPTTAVVVRADEVFVHCAKAFRRGKVWAPESWADAGEVPEALDVLVAQGVIPPVDDDIRAGMEQDYELGLAWDAPEAATPES
jgi:PPOX class probable FMN-dependent enzyme